MSPVDLRRLFLAACLLAATHHASAHDIPNARVDRSTQVTLSPGRVRIDYEVSLSELTLTQELRSLVGHLPGSDRAGWFAAYGRETGPMNARGFLISSGEKPITLTSLGFDLSVEEHPRYTFHFEAEVPGKGRLTVRDTNFVSSEGTSRLAVRGRGVSVQGDDLPPDVAEIPIRPKWQLSDEEEARTREVTVDYAAQEDTIVARPSVPPRGPFGSVSVTAPPPSQPGLSTLLDRASNLSLAVLALVAFGLGAAHAIQPGHGKTLVVATVLGDRGDWTRSLALAAVTTLTHTGSVLLIALALWWTSSVAFAGLHVALTRAAGYVMAVVGVYRVGRHLAGLTDHSHVADETDTSRGLVALGIAGGIVPCWDAVGLVVLGEAVGRLGLAVLLVLTFSLGLGVVLAALGWAAHAFRQLLTGGAWEAAWARRLGLSSGLALSALGVYLFVRPIR